MTKVNYLGLFLISALLLFTACESETTTNNPDPISTGDEIDFQKMVIEFGLTTFQNAIDKKVNVLISPLSLETALYMTMNGTAGTTLEEFRTALRSDKFYPEGLNAEYAKLIDKLSPKNPATSLGLANTVFYDQEKVTFSDAFMDVISEIFKGDFNEANFLDPASVDLINDWAKNNTEERIKKILDSISPEEAIFLINALHFKADWEKGFHPNSTFKYPFITENGNSFDVDVMFSDDTRRFYKGDDFSALDMKLTDDEFSMTFIVPADDISTVDFVKGFSEEEFYDFYINLYTTKLVEGRILTRLPKFEIESNMDMKDILQDMGMVSTFTSANLSNMGNFQGNTSISRILHDTYIKVDEKGIEGAAVTSVGIAVTSAPPVLDFTKPFFFILRHVETNTPVFIGKMGDPR